MTDPELLAMAEVFRADARNVGGRAIAVTYEQAAQDCETRGTELRTRTPREAAPDD